MSRSQIPDRPPRKRQRSGWRQFYQLLLAAGIALIVIGSVLTFGFPGFELGGTDSPPSDGPADDPPGADGSNDGRDDGDSDEADRDENPDDAERAGLGSIAAASPEDGSPMAGDAENVDECWIE